LPWLALRDCLPTLGRRDWLLATMSGAAAAWSVGMGVGSTAGETLALPESAMMVLLGAALIGAAAGVLLSVTQALDPRARRSWAAGMAVAFAGAGLIGPETPLPAVAVIGAATGLGMGGLVAALTGLALVRLLRDVRKVVT
jgi:hypothetical protein